MGKDAQLDGHRAPTVAIIGAGMAGIATAVRLKRAGIHSFTIFEKSDGPGGTWRHNSYPGAGCDVQSHLYSFSFNLKPDWTWVYASRAEILAYAEETVDRFGVRPHCRFRTGVAELRWREDSQHWILRTDTGESLTFDLVISCVGLLDVPRIPALPGLEVFRGPAFHTARWEHEHDLTGKRVGIVGNGSSAGQVAPAIAPHVEELYVFQREANWVRPKLNRKYSKQEIARFQRSSLARLRERYGIYLRREMSYNKIVPGSSKHREFTAENLAYLAQAVKDPEVRALLTPKYPFGCKRIMFDDDFLPAFNRPNVTLVPSAVVGLTPTGVITEDGAERELDVLVFATGFQPASFLQTFDVFGADGKLLNDVWAESGGPEAFLGMTVPGFPNLFISYGPNTNSATTSVIFVLELQAAYFVRAVKGLRKRRAAALEIRPQAMQLYNRWLQRRMPHTAWLSGCHNYYRAPSGKIVTNWPRTSILYWALLRILRPSPVLYRWTDSGRKTGSDPAIANPQSSGKSLDR